MDDFSYEFLCAPTQLSFLYALIAYNHLTELKLLIQAQTLNELKLFV
jgi:hypothetical protein